MEKKDNTKIECRIWRYSKLIGEKVFDVEEEYTVKIIKVARGKLATDNKTQILEEADYIRFSGTTVNCLDLLNATIEEEVKPNSSHE